MISAEDLVCPCGAPAPESLPPAGRRPVPCADCGVPLVAPGGLPRASVERGAGVALLVASVAAVAWMLAVRETGADLHAALPVVGALVGVGAVLGARARGPGVQWAAAGAFAAFLVLGEVLVYRGALIERLVALHRAEGAVDAEALARQERATMGLADWLHVELSMSLFVGFGAGLALAMLVARAPPAVEAFLRGPVGAAADSCRASVPEPEPERDPVRDAEEPPPCP